jgi:hypothetical protein
MPWSVRRRSKRVDEEETVRTCSLMYLSWLQIPMQAEELVRLGISLPHAWRSISQRSLTAVAGSVGKLGHLDAPVQLVEG